MKGYSIGFLRGLFDGQKDPAVLLGRKNADDF